MIDLHAHVLPGVDDGPETLEEALAMCRLAVSDGVEVMVATPHQRHELWENGDPVALEAVRRSLELALGGGLRLLLGGEVRWDSELLADLDTPTRGGALPLAGSHYILLEPGLDPPVLDPVELVHELGLAGWRPIISHPERIPYVAGDPGLLAALARRGALFQITAGSLTGKLGRKPQGWAEQMIERGLVQLVASDAHDAVRRPPLLGEAHSVIAKRWGAELAERLLTQNPRAVIEDRPVAGGPS